MKSDNNQLGGSVNIDLDSLSTKVNIAIPIVTIAFFAAAYFYDSYFYIGAALFTYLQALNIYYLYIQKEHTLLSNFGIMAQMRYIFESIGPEFRQYFFSNDTEERPFNRVERSDVYKKAKGLSSTSAFGSQLEFNNTEIKLRHSMFPTNKKNLKPFSLIMGGERKIKNTYEMKNPIMISAMSYGSLGKRAVEALSRGAKKAGILMNTGEGGYPKYHLIGGADLIFQMGTGKFGTRNDDSSLNEVDLKNIANLEQVKMIEIKMSQGAKPGKGGILPKEKVDKEISELRSVPMGKDVISPARHIECVDAESTVKFIKRVQEVSEIPVGIKLCLGRKAEFEKFVLEMRRQDIFPDYISIDGAEGGTGAAPKAFMDDIGLPVQYALPLVHRILKENGVRDRLKLFAAGRLITPGKQMMAMADGADAIYSARAFMLAIGCIQALQCNNNTCPVGITTHQKHLESGLDIKDKAERVEQFVKGLLKDQEMILCSLGKESYDELSEDDLFRPNDTFFT